MSSEDTSRVKELPKQLDARTIKAGRAQRARWEAERCHDAFESTSNPVLAWEAFGWARAAGIDVPAWVLRYLDQSALGIRVLHVRPPREGQVHKAVAHALGFRSSPKGIKNPFSGGRAPAWQMVLAMEVGLAREREYPNWRNGEEINWSWLFEHGVVAKLLARGVKGVSVAKVRRAWQRYGADLRVQPLLTPRGF